MFRSPTISVKQSVLTDRFRQIGQRTERYRATRRRAKFALCCGDGGPNRDLRWEARSTLSPRPLLGVDRSRLFRPLQPSSFHQPSAALPTARRNPPIASTSSLSHTMKRVAVVGSGVSGESTGVLIECTDHSTHAGCWCGLLGLAATWVLNEHADDVEVHLFEADDRPGGHTNTVDFTTSRSSGGPSTRVDTCVPIRLGALNRRAAR